ncbi:MAG: hypothetical protein PHO02_05850 [Candidatus Nanoarchaeia archaeon]|nr:hypothetical protein [Candidatus Nanoarchaeia archaeon]
MIYDRKLGRTLALKYLSEPEFQKKLIHSFGVGEFAFLVASKIMNRHPAIGDLVPERAGFLGYVHDIGVSRCFLQHEIPSIDILVEEGVEHEIARRAMHGQMEEQYGNGDGRYLPVGIEGLILTYSDMSIHVLKPISIEDRADDIKQRVSNAKGITPEQKNDIIVNLDKAYPRYKRYENIVLLLSGANSFNDF